MTDVLPDEATTPPTFDVLPLSAETRAALVKMGYTNPSPVQRAVFEPATAGRDLVVQAQTGTGKTTAFGLPIVEYAIRRNVAAVQVMVLCPTRELAIQVSNEITRLGEGRSIKPVAIYGGAPMGKQIDALNAGAQVVVGTPGRTLDHLRRGTLDPSNIRMLVLDEADEMLSMGFEREITAILDNLPKERQTLLFSATLPVDIERMARTRLKTPEFITLSGDHVGALSITHFAFFVRDDKRDALLRVLEVENPESAVIFCNTKPETETACAVLQNAGYEAEWLNGDLEQNERERVMSATREGKVRFLVATDVAARGIDISHLTHVINFDFPETAEGYVHRTGRTGRAGRTGTAISLVTPQDVGNLYYLRLTYGIRPFERQIPSAAEVRTRKEVDLLQMLVERMLAEPVHPEDLQLARRVLSHDRVDAIVGALLRDKLGPRQAVQESASAARRAKPPSPRPVLAEAAPATTDRVERSAPPAREPSAPRESRDGRRDAREPRADAPNEPRSEARGEPRGEPRPEIRSDASQRGGRSDRGERPGDRGHDRHDRGDRGRGERFERGERSGRGEGGERAPRSEDQNGPERGASTPERGPRDRREAERTDADRDVSGRSDPSRSASSGAHTTSSGSPAATSTAQVDSPTSSSPSTPRREAPFAATTSFPGVTAPSEVAPPTNVAPAIFVPSSAPPLPHVTPSAGQPPVAIVSAEAPAGYAGREVRRPRSRRGQSPDVLVDEPAFRFTVEGSAAIHPPAAPAHIEPAPRPAELTSWQPPEEEGDDRPILHATPRPNDAQHTPESAEGADLDGDDVPADTSDFVAVFVDVGRRDGAKPGDFQRALRDRGNIGRRETGRIRVRERHTFVYVPRDLLGRAIEALTGAVISGRTASAEPARERAGEGQELS